MSAPVPPRASAAEAALIVTICFGWFIASSLAAVSAGFPSSGSFSDAALFDIAFMEVVFAAIALLVLRMRGYPLQDFAPDTSLRGSLLGVGLCVAASMASLLAVLAVFGNSFPEQPIERMVAQSRPSMLMLSVLAVVNGLYEETFLLGYLVRVFRTHGVAVAVGISLLVRLLYHLYQGPVGAVSVLAFGAVLSVFYWYTRALWPAAVAHTAADAFALM